MQRKTFRGWEPLFRRNVGPILGDGGRKVEKILHKRSSLSTPKCSYMDGGVVEESETYTPAKKNGDGNACGRFDSLGVKRIYLGANLIRSTCRKRGVLGEGKLLLSGGWGKEHS